jgi:hypothetical protein
VAGQEGDPGVTWYAPGSAKNVRDWTFTLPSELPCWELKSQMDSRIFRTRFQGSKPIALKSFLYHWKAIGARIAHLDIWNTSYGQKKGRELNWQFDSQPLKVGNWPNFLACRQRATYRWKAFNKGYNFPLDFIAIEGHYKKLCALKIARVPIVGISGPPLGSPETKSHLDVALMERHRLYYKGEGGAFPQVWAVVSLVCPSCSWFVLAPKVFQLCT